MSFALYIPIGPGSEEVTRASDVIDSVVSYSQRLKWIVIVDDSVVSRGYKETFSIPPQCELIVLQNPRLGRGNGRTGGLCVGSLIAFEYIQRRTDAAFALKLDSDSLVIGAFEQQIEEALAALPDAGLLGVIGDSFGENRTYNVIKHNAAIFQRALLLGEPYTELSSEDSEFLRHLGVTSSSHFDSFLKARAILKSARAAGYKLGEYCQGGGYVVSRKMLDLMVNAELFSTPLIWSDLQIGEDLMIGMCCGAIAQRMYDLSGPNRVFAVQPGCLPLSRQQLTAMNSSIIHSLDGCMEQEFRDFFRTKRD